MRDDRSPLYRHGIVAKIVAEYIARLENSFSCWRNRLGFMDSFRISRADSGFPVFQNVLELENDRRTADRRLANIPKADELRAEMADFILRHKEFPDGAAASRWPSGSIWRTSAPSWPSGPSRWPRRSRFRSIRRPCGPTISSTGRPSTAPPTCRWSTWRRWRIPRKHGPPAGRRRRQAQRQGRHPAAGRRPAQSRTRPPLRRFHREELRLLAVAGDDRRQSRQGFRADCTPSSCGASCSARSIRPASPRTIRRWPRCWRRCASRKTPGC